MNPDAASLKVSEYDEVLAVVPSLRREGVMASALGVVIGTAAGLIGVGGGEFRIPVLTHLLRFPVKIAAGANTVIGLFVVVVGVIRRWGQHEWTTDDLTLAGIMAAVALPGSALGALLAGKLPSRPLKKFVCGYLLLVGAWMLVEAVAHAEHILLAPIGISRWVLAAVASFVIALLSGALGVAGGEMRIPAFLYLFGVPIKDAGTISLIVSIPTVAASAVTYRRTGHMPNAVLRIAVLMGIGSVLGVLFGAALVPHVDKHTLKGILGVILILATVRLAVPAPLTER